jgi:hypothetical protein
MNFDLKRALDFAESKNYEKIQKDNESSRKKRRVYYESTSYDNASPHMNTKFLNTVSALSLEKKIDPKIPIEMETDHLSKVLFEKDIVDQDNIAGNDNMQENTNDYSEIINSLSTTFESPSNSPIINENLLHHYTNMSTDEFCSQFMKILRDSHTCKLHANRLLSLIRSILPTPNEAPATTEKLFKMLEIENFVLSKQILCTVCNNSLSSSDTCCQKCLCSDNKCFASVYVMNVEQLIKKIYVHLKTDIDEYRQHLKTMNDRDETNDIGFNKIYQQLLKINISENFITFLLYLDGISISKSSSLKMWIFSGSIIELRPHLRNRRYNMVLFSLWFSYTEPNAQIWLKQCINLLKFIKIKGNFITKGSSFWLPHCIKKKLSNRKSSNETRCI